MDRAASRLKPRQTLEDLKTPKGRERGNSYREDPSPGLGARLFSGKKGAAARKNEKKEGRGGGASGPESGAGKSGGKGIKSCFFVISSAACLAAIFFAVGFGLVRGYYFFTTSQYFALKTIEIEGINRLESREVLDIVGINYGMNTLSISMESMEKALSRAPWVESLSIKRVLPDRFNIVIKEREPVYWRNLNGVLHYADRWGQPIAPVTPGSFSSLPALDIEPGAEDLAGRLPYLVNSLTRADLPLDTAALAWLRLSSAGALELKPSDKLSIVIGIEDWQSNLERLNAVLYDLSRRGELRDTAEIKAHGNHVWVSKRMHT